MMRSVFGLSHKVARQMAAGVLSRSASTETTTTTTTTHKMEDYFKGKRFVVTGSSAGQ